MSQEEIFIKVKENAEKYYKSIGSIFNPFLSQNVNFNAKGLDHIKFKEWNKPRLKSQQYLRLKFLKLAPKIIEKAATLQEYNETKIFERRNINSRWEKQLVSVKYFCFIAIINYSVKVKIIIKEIEGGQPFFWSIVPFWKNRKNLITEQTKKVFHEGDLEFQ